MEEDHWLHRIGNVGGKPLSRPEEEPACAKSVRITDHGSHSCILFQCEERLYDWDPLFFG